MRAFAIAPDQVKVSFERDDAGNVILLRLHQGGAVFDVPREGTALAKEQTARPIFVRDIVNKYTGKYQDPESGRVIEVYLDEKAFGIHPPEGGAVQLRWSGEEGRYEVRAGPRHLHPVQRRRRQSRLTHADHRRKRTRDTAGGG